MEEYISLFNTTAEFENAESGLTMPHVSVTKDDMSVHYKPIPETKLVAKFKITDTSNPTPISYINSSTHSSGTTGFSAIEIDGVELPSVVSAYTFSTRGYHTVKYTLKDSTSIGSWAVAYCHNIISVKIPSSVTNIGHAAFDGCSSLTSIDIPNSVISIDRYAFQYCSGLTSIDIPSGVTSIGESAFNGCNSLTSITIPNSVTSIGRDVFDSCNSLTSITVNSNNTVYDSRDNCNAIIETNTNELIQGCNNTVIPNTVTSIGYGAFGGCSGLTSINIPNSVISIGINAFNDCSGLTSVTIPNSVTSIGNQAFWKCTSLTSIVIPNSVTSINGDVFLGCSSLTSITIPNSVTSIGGRAFDGCSSLTSINIPSGVTSIGVSAFTECTSLTSITCNAMTAPTIQSSTFRDIKTNGILYVPTGSSGYGTWMQNANYYLGLYNWTKEERFNPAFSD